MAYRILIVEDSSAEADVLRGHLSRYAAEKGLSFAVTVLPSAIEFVNGNHPADLIFMDIDLPGINGMEAAQMLRGYDEQTPLVFVTNLAQYAIKGYEVSALDFVVKPVRYPTFAFKLARAVEVASRKRRSRITIPTRDGMRTLNTAEVIRHKLIYHTMQGTFEVWDSLKNASAALEPFGFALCNACYLVNLDKVVGVSQDMVTVEGGDELKMSRGRKREFMDALTRPTGG